MIVVERDSVEFHLEFVAEAELVSQTHSLMMASSVLLVVELRGLMTKVVEVIFLIVKLVRDREGIWFKVVRVGELRVVVVVKVGGWRSGR